MMLHWCISEEFINRDGDGDRNGWGEGKREVGERKEDKEEDKGRQSSYPDSMSLEITSEVL